jgi:multidrug efflux pump subunit AcrA (membrane-fusion protein)
MPTKCLLAASSFAWLISACPTAVPLSVALHEHKPDHSVVLRGSSASYVTVEPAGPASHLHSRTLVARVAFDERKVAALGPPVQGRVASVNVVVGDRVEKGAPLLTIHAPDIAAALAQVAETKTARSLAEKNAERARMLMQRGAGSEAETLTTVRATMRCAHRSRASWSSATCRSEAKSAPDKTNPA